MAQMGRVMVGSWPRQHLFLSCFLFVCLAHAEGALGDNAAGGGGGTPETTPSGPVPLDPPPFPFHCQVEGSAWKGLEGNYTLTEDLGAGVSKYPALVDPHHVYLELTQPKLADFRNKYRIFYMSQMAPSHMYIFRTRWVLYGACAPYKSGCEEFIPYCSSGYDQPIDEEAGWIHASGVPSVADDVTQFVRCSPCDPALATWDSLRGVCQCNPGLVGPVSPISNACTGCARGKFKPAATESFPEPGSCLECGQGVYSDTMGSSVCAACPPGNFSSKFGATSCPPCPFNTYKNESGPGNCTSCGNNAVTLTQGNKGKSGCACAPGYSGTTGIDVCENGDLTTKESCTQRGCCMWVDDDAGTADGGDTPAATPAPAPGGRRDTPATTPAPDAESPTDSPPSGEATSSPTTPAPRAESPTASTPSGEAANSTVRPLHPGCNSAVGSFVCDVCEMCPRGKYKTSIGSARCLECEMGKFSTSLGLRLPLSISEQKPDSPCKRNSAGCKKCPPGLFQNSTAATACFTCPPGYYTDVAGLSSCLKCPGPGADPRSVSIFSLHDHTGCAEACPAGFFSTIDLECRPCPTCQNNTDNKEHCRALDCNDVDKCWNYTSRAASSSIEDCIPIKHSKPAGTTTTMSASIELTTPPPESAGEQETEAAVLSTNTIVIICIIVFAVVMCRMFDGRRQVTG